MAGAACFAAGLVSFELISYHFSTTATVTAHWIPLFFAIAMATDAIASLIFGKLFDRIGIPVVLMAFLISSCFAPFIFLGNFSMALVGMILWGIGFGAQDTLLKALIASILPEGKRNLAFGLFYTGYGGGWLVGSVITGLLYAQSRYLLVAFSVTLQLVSLPFFIVAKKSQNS
jgi:MFS family permease